MSDRPIYTPPDCAKPDCQEGATLFSAYCCPSCERADRGRYEIHEDGPLGHSPECIYWGRKRIENWRNRGQVGTGSEEGRV